MAIVGEVGYDGIFEAASFASGKTYINVSDPATATGILNTVRVNRNDLSARTVRVSSWEEISLKYYRQSYVDITVPAGTGDVDVSLPTPLHFDAGWYIGFYATAITLKGTGGASHQHIWQSGDVDQIQSIPPAPYDNVPTLWGDLETPPSVPVLLLTHH